MQIVWAPCHPKATALCTQQVRQRSSSWGVSTHVYQLDYSPPSLAEYYSMHAYKSAAYSNFQRLDNHCYRKLK